MQDVLNVSKKLMMVRQKMQMYYQNKKTPPEKLEADFLTFSEQLDAKVTEALQTMPEFKEHFIELAMQEEDEVIAQVESCYRRALAYGSVKNKHYRLFYLPFVYEQGKSENDFAIKKNQKEALEEYILSYLEQQGFENVGQLECKLYPNVLLSWYVADDEELHVQKLARATFEGKTMNLSEFFKAREIAREQNRTDLGGLSLGVIPFVLISEDPIALGMSDLDEDLDAFEEHCQDLLAPAFDTTIHCNAPIDPDMLTEELIKSLWNAQFNKVMDQMIAIKKPEDRGVVQVTHLWENEEMVAVLIDFQLYRVKHSKTKGGARQFEGEGGHHLQEIYFDKQLSREALVMEEPGQIAQYIVEHPQVLRTDIDVVFSNRMGSLDDIFKDSHDDTQD